MATTNATFREKQFIWKFARFFPPRHSCCCPTNPSNSNCKQTTQTIEYTHNYCYYVFVSQKNELRKIVGCMNSSQTPLCNEYFRANTKVGRTWIDSLEIRRRWLWNIHSLVKFPGICSVKFVTAQSAFAWIELNADKFDATHTHDAHIQIGCVKLGFVTWFAHFYIQVR